MTQQESGAPCRYTAGRTAVSCRNRRYQPVGKVPAFYAAMPSTTVRQLIGQVPNLLDGTIVGRAGGEHVYSVVGARCRNRDFTRVIEVQCGLDSSPCIFGFLSIFRSCWEPAPRQLGANIAHFRFYEETPLGLAAGNRGRGDPVA